MKRKLLREFADYLEKRRAPFDTTNCTKCIAADARRFVGDRNVIRDGSCGSDLVNIFKVGYDTAHAMYSAHHLSTRKLAAKAVRYFARTGDDTVFLRTIR